jgi:predicted amidohydrolase YtcJ
MSGMTSTLYRAGHVFSAAVPGATALLVTDDRIAWIGPVADAPTADAVVDLDGALVAPAFVDAHVHTTDTGLTLAGLDLTHTRSAGELLDAVAAFVEGLPASAVVLGHGWDESTWTDQTPPSAQELDRAAGGRMVYLSQASIHSALCSASLLAACAAQDAPGYDASGWLRRAAHHVARGIAFGSITAAQRRAAQAGTLRTAASLGIAAVHECGGPGTSSETDFTDVLSLGGVLSRNPEVYGYWGELMGAAKAVELGAVGAGGDLYADGALGARTAHLREPYISSDPDDANCGHGYLTEEQVEEHIVDCVRHGVQGGFHAIGDRALSTVVAGLRAAADVVGLDRLRAARHRIEHVEIVDKQIIAGLVEFGVVASMQPAFDRLWGGEGQMYAQRLGVPRSLASNPFGAMHGVGVALAFGSDSPVTPLDPWGSVRAAMRHHNPAYRMNARAAFAAHTRGGWRAVHRDDEGVLTPGAPATFAAWHAPSLTDGLPTLVAASADEPAPSLPRCRRTVLRGQAIFSSDDT